MQRKVRDLVLVPALVTLSLIACAQEGYNTPAVSAVPSSSVPNTQQMVVAADSSKAQTVNVDDKIALSSSEVASSAPESPSAPAPAPPPAPALTDPAAADSNTPPRTPVPTPAPKIDIHIENLNPSAAALEKGRLNYAHYCADCHGANGEGSKGPKLVGSLIVTGPVYGHLSIVLNGHSKSIMPTWGISELSDDVIAGIITYQRNAWGNNNKKEFGRHAGGVVSSEWVHVYRKMMKNLPVKQDVRT